MYEFMNMFFNMIGGVLFTVVIPIIIYSLTLKYGSELFRKLFKKK